MFPAAMRLGSLEVVVVIAAFAVVALRRCVPGGAAAAPSSGPPVPRTLELEIVERGRSRRVEAVTPVIVGRSPDAGVLVMDPEVSRRHASFDAEDDAVFVSDLGSSNGTLLNGHPVRESIEIRPGDRIDVGPVRILFVGSKRGTNGHG